MSATLYGSDLATPVVSGSLDPAAAARRAALNAAELSYWQEVPELVSERYKEAAAISLQLRKNIQKVIKHLPSQGGYGYVFWHPEKKQLWAVLGDGDDQAVHNRWHNALRVISGVQSVTSEAEGHPPDPENWIRIKRADATLGIAAKPFEWAGKLNGGPSPLSNAIVGGLLGGGAGYLGGAAIEHLFPERFVGRGRLRKSLGMLGAGMGAIPGAWQAQQNLRHSQLAGKPLGASALWTPNEQVPINPGTIDSSNQLLKGSSYPVPEILLKAAAGYAQDMFAAGSGVQSIPRDAFNNAIWNDVRKGMTASQNPFGTKSQWGDDSQGMHTPPPVAAAAVGLVTGVDEMYGRPSLLSPQHFINGLAAAGVDLATAHVAGGVLGALGGLKPAAQEQLQNMGVWGGLVRGVVGSVLGM